MRRDDKLAKWCKNHPKLFHNTDNLADQAKTIIKKHPKLIKSKHKHEIADPFIIALAVRYKSRLIVPIIVTAESVEKESGIPYVARDYDVCTCNRLEMFENEAWRF